MAWTLLVISLLVGLVWPEVGAAIGSTGYGALALHASIVGNGDATATIHDWLHAKGKGNRLEADRIFSNPLRSSGVATWRATVM